jgi:hypothetical protein
MCFVGLRTRGFSDVKMLHEGITMVDSKLRVAVPAIHFVNILSADVMES